MINPWTQGRVPGVRLVPTLGAWQNRRKLASAAWVPPQWARISLQGAHIYFYEFPALILLAGATDLTRVTIAEDFWVVTTMAQATRPSLVNSGSFRLLVY